MKLGIVGLPNVGKSTLFNAITNAGIQSENFPFCTIEPNIGVVEVPDKRLELLSNIYKSKKIVKASVNFFDIAGLVKGASKGEGLGNKFLSNIRECDAIIHVVRCFEDENIIHVEGKVSPKSDIETIELELIFSDIEVLEKKIQKSKKQLLKDELEFYEELKNFLEQGKSARLFKTNKSEDNYFKNVELLTSKPLIFVANMSEEDFKNNVDTSKHYKEVKKIAEETNSVVLPICADLEMQISDMDEKDKKIFLSELNLEESSLDRLVKKSYELLGLISFLTSGEIETRAWTITKGTKAPAAASKIHTDIEKGFIKAEVVSCKELLKAGSIQQAKNKGFVRLEGKEYVMQDGDVVNFRFNV